MSNKQGQPPCEHTVEPGDTFPTLAKAYYGDGSDVNAQKIASANPGVSPTSLQIGQKLQIPEAKPTPIPPPTPTPTPLPGGSVSSQPYKVVGYFENWAQYRPKGNGKFLPEDIEPSLLTHINFAFAIFGFYTWSAKPDKPGEVIPGEARYTNDYTIQPVEGNDQTVLYPGIQKLKEKNPNLKTFISIGGWSFNNKNDEPSEGNPHPCSKRKDRFGRANIRSNFQG